MKGKAVDYLYVVGENWRKRGYPVLYRARIVSRGPKTIRIADAHLAFSCRTVVRPREYAETPRDAWRRFIEKMREVEMDAQYTARNAAALRVRALKLADSTDAIEEK